MLEKVGVEPTGEAFNAIVLDEASNRPFNPLVNAGAIATADLIQGKDFADRIKRLLAMFGRYVGREVYIDNAIFMSERTTGHRNRAIAHLMLNFGMVSDRIEESLELYFQQCSILVNCPRPGRDGRDAGQRAASIRSPASGRSSSSTSRTCSASCSPAACTTTPANGPTASACRPRAASAAASCAVVPGQFGIGIFSPPLDASGNSVRGIKVCEELSERFGLHAFELGFDGERLEEQFRLRKGR